MNLTKVEEAMASGKHGPGIEKCMNILIKVGEAFGAEQLVGITSAHTMPKEPPDLLNEMTEGVAGTGVFTTLHSLMSAFDPHCWQKMGRLILASNRGPVEYHLSENGQRALLGEIRVLQDVFVFSA